MTWELGQSDSVLAENLSNSENETFVFLDLLLEPAWPVDLGTGVGKEEKENKEMESVPNGSPASSKCPTEFCHLELSEALLCHKNNPLFTYTSLCGFLYSGWKEKTELQQRDSTPPNRLVCTRMYLDQFSMIPAL